MQGTPTLNSLCYSISLKLFIRQAENDRELPYAVSLPRCPQQLELGQPKARSQELGTQSGLPH